MFGGRLVLVLLALILAMPVALASETIDINFNLYDFQTKELISDTHVNLILYNPLTNKEVNTVKFVDESGILNFQIEPGEWEVALKIDDITTLGVDYYFESTFQLNEDVNEKLFLLPVGTIRGVVYDGSKNVLPNVDLKFECSGNYGDQRNKRTDSFGSFQKEWLPVGSCRISSLLEGVVGFKYVTVTHGQINNVEISLQQEKNYSYLFFVGGIFLILAVIAYINRDALKNLIFVSHEVVKDENLSEPQEKIKPIESIMKTLSGKERKVLEFLIQNPQSTQAKIKNSTSIPKTTLSRILRNLEQKQIIKIDRIDRLKKIELTDWILKS